MRYLSFVFATLLLASGCSYVHTEKANLNEAPNGVRVFPSKFYLAVDTEKKQSTIFYAPDTKNAYDMKPVTILAKHDFQVDIEEGQVKTLKSNQDTTAFLTFIKDAGTTAAKAAGLPVSSTNIEGTFGLQTGLYTLDENGALVRVITPR